MSIQQTNHDEHVAGLHNQIVELKTALGDKEALIARLRADIPIIEFTYVNWRGEIRDRKVRILGLRHGTTEWYPTPCWLVRGFDMEKKAEREFALMNMRPVGSTLVVDYDTKQVQHALSEVLGAARLLSDALLADLRSGSAAMQNLGGAGILFHRNMQRMDHVSKRIAGGTTDPFTYEPIAPQIPAGDAKTMG